MEIQTKDELPELGRPEDPNTLGKPATLTPKHDLVRSILELCNERAIDPRLALSRIVDALAKGDAQALGWAEIEFWDDAKACSRSRSTMVIPAADWQEIARISEFDPGNRTTLWREGRKPFWDEVRFVDWAACEAGYVAFGLDSNGDDTHNRINVKWRDIRIHAEQYRRLLADIDPTMARRRAPALQRPTVTDAQIVREMRKMRAQGHMRDEICKAIPTMPGFEGVTNSLCRQIFNNYGLAQRGRPKAKSSEI